MANDTSTTHHAVAREGRRSDFHPDVAAVVDQVLADFVTARSAELAATDPALGLLAETARDAVLSPGKRLRPTFAYWGWRGAAGRAAAPEPIMPALAALEMLHTFALVHDDVMDDAPLRRGRPSAHRALAHAHRGSALRGDGTRFGYSGAILVGDLCLVWADELIGQSQLPADRLRAARQAYDRMRADAIAGQFLDVLAESAREWSVEQALLTARLKTASYTVMWPLLYGAALAGDSAAYTPAFQRYGVAVGEAFQLRDDLLDLYGETMVTRKPVGADVAKPTVLLQLAAQRADRRQAGELARLTGPSRRGGPRDLARLAALVTETGATEQVHRMIGARVSEGVDALEHAPIEPYVRHALRELALTVAWRNS